MGGVDLCFGRWDTPQHSLVDDDFEPGTVEGERGPVWPGKDYSNPVRSSSAVLSSRPGLLTYLDRLFPRFLLACDGLPYAQQADGGPVRPREGAEDALVGRPMSRSAPLRL